MLRSNNHRVFDCFADRKGLSADSRQKCAHSRQESADRRQKTADRHGAISNSATTPFLYLYIPFREGHINHNRKGDGYDGSK